MSNLNKYEYVLTNIKPCKHKLQLTGHQNMEKSTVITNNLLFVLVNRINSLDNKYTCM